MQPFFFFFDKLYLNNLILFVALKTAVVGESDMQE